MSSVRFAFPTLKLEQLIHAPGGLAVSEALARADANLETLKPTSREELLLLLDLADDAFARINDVGATAGLAGLYEIAVRGIGAGSVCGAPAVDGALESLCDLIDHLQSGHQGAGEEAIAVHLRSWRLLMDPHLPRPGAAAILEGLKKVSARHAPVRQDDPERESRN